MGEDLGELLGYFGRVQESHRTLLNASVSDKESKKHPDRRKISGCASHGQGSLKGGHIGCEMILADLHGREMFLLQELQKARQIPAVGLNGIFRKPPLHLKVADESIQQMVAMMMFAHLHCHSSVSLISPNLSPAPFGR